MANKTLLQIIATAQTELNLPATTLVIASTDPLVLQMLALLNALGEELRDYPEEGWSFLETEFNLVVNAPVTTTGTTALNSPIITGIPSTAGLSAYAWIVTGSGVPQAARIKSVDSSTQVTMTMEATAAGTTTLIFAQDTYAMPSDFKYQQNRTWWDRTNRWPLFGPDSPQMDQWLRSGIIATGPRRHFRIIGSSSANSGYNYRIWPPPVEITSPLQLVYEYQSTNWVNVTGAGTSFATAYANDTDTSLLDDRALISGLKWSLWRTKGFGYADEKNDWIDLVDRLIARDGAAENLSLVRRNNPLFISPQNIMDGNWPGPTGTNMT